MGFPNVDKILVKLFMAGFTSLKVDPTPIADIFSDLEVGEIAEVAQYVASKDFTTDLRDRDTGKVYLMPNFPLIDMPFPQIAINLGKEDSDRFIGDETGHSLPVVDTNQNVIAWDIIKGYYAPGNWTISVVTTTKDEAIWLTRCCQYFICQAFLLLESKGLMEINLSISDMQLSQEQLPMTVFNRTINLSGKTANTWKVRVPAAAEYGTGVNIAA